MRLEIRELQAKLGITSLYVTHDQVEAMTMADRMIVMNAGRAEQIGTPLDVYERPATLFAAQFIGSPSMNVLEVEGREGALCLGDMRLPNPRGHSGPVMLGLRPEHLTPDPQGAIAMQVQLAEPLGANTLLHGKLPTGQGFTASLPGVHTVAHGGETLRLGIKPANMHLFDRATGMRLGS
jgi:sn-glycerol 3-phosphate transport system ATP-binding protein